jgi:hypothetical protein
MTSSSAKRIENYVELLKSKAAELRNREKLCHALSDYIHSAGGWTTSTAGDFRHLRAEIPPNSEIPIRLAERSTFWLSEVLPLSFPVPSPSPAPSSVLAYPA